MVMTQERAKVNGRGVYTGDPLTRAEREVATLLAEGCTNEDIGRARFTSVGTAKHQVEHVIVKLGARNRTHAAAIWARKMLIFDLRATLASAIQGL